MSLSTAKPQERDLDRKFARRDAELLHSTAIHLLRKLRRLDELPIPESSPRRSETRSAGATLNGPRLSALSVIVFGGPIALGQLAAAEQVRPPTMTRIVHALAAQGLVTKTADPADARSIRIAATLRGKRALLAGRVRRTQALAHAVSRLPAADQLAVRRALPILAKVNRLLERGIWQVL